MKFLAILRDSLREAIDTKVFFVMIGLSGLLFLLALSITYKPRPAKEAFQWIAIASYAGDVAQGAGSTGEQIQMQMMMGRKGAELFVVEQVEALDNTSRPYDSGYRVKLQRIGDSPRPEEQLKTKFGRLGPLQMVDVKSVKSIGDNQFEITTAPTKATALAWPTETYFLFGLVHVIRGQGIPLGFQLYFLQSGMVVGLGGWVALLVSIIITAFFIPNMLRKGTIDLLLVKPIRRPQLLVYKYVGGLTFIFLNTTVALTLVWLAFGLRSGIWASGLLWTILILTFFFAILYSVSTLFGVLTQSPIAAILLTCMIWFFLFLVGQGYQYFESRDDQGTFADIVRAVHYVLPRTSDLGVLNNRMLTRELLTGNQLAGESLDSTPITWRESITVSLAFVVAMLALSSWRFSRKDY